MTWLLPICVVFMLAFCGASVRQVQSQSDVPALPAPRPFRIDCLDCPRSFQLAGDRSMQLSPGQNPHLVYTGEGRVYHAWRSASGWRSEVVAETQLPLGKLATSWTAALDFDPGGTAWFAYTGDNRLALARQTASGWLYQMIDDFLGAEASVSALQFDSAGFAHIPYYDSIQQKLLYAHQTASGWSIDEIDRGEAVGFRVSFVLDSQGYGRMTYSAPKVGGGLNYAYQDAGGWHIQQVDPAPAGMNTSLALDAQGIAHISYSSAGPSDLRYAIQGPGGWITETVASSGYVGASNSLALAPGDVPCIAYNDQPTYRLFQACKTGAGWSVQQIDGDAGEAPSLLYDPQGHFQIASFAPSTGQLIWTAEAIPAPIQEIVDTSIRLGHPVAVQVDESGYAHVLYHQMEPFVQVRYAFQDAQGWHNQPLPQAPMLCESLALDSQNTPHLACVSLGTARLVYATLGAGGWITQTLWVSGSFGNLGGYASIAIDQTGHPGISFYDSTQQHLFYTTLSPTGWISETVNTYGGLYTSLALGTGDFPRISYIRADNGRPELATRDDQGWHFETPALESGKFTSLALDIAGQPHLATMQDQNGCKLRYLERSQGTWSSEILDQGVGGCTGLFPSLRLDPAGWAHIAYFDEANGELRYVYQDSAGWHHQAVDAGSGVSSSLALNPGNRAWIAYLDYSHADIKLAYTVEQVYLPGVWFPALANHQ